MFRAEYVAIPIEETLTGTEDHLPVVATLRISRKSAPHRNRKIPRESWNHDNLANSRKVEAFRQERDNEFHVLLESNDYLEDVQQEHTVEELVESLTKILHTSARRHIKRKKTYYKYHLSRAEKQEHKLRQTMATFTRKYKRDLHDKNSARYKQLAEMKIRIQTLQEKQKFQRERYLDRQIRNAHIQKDINRLQRLLDNYQTENSKVVADQINCVKDGENFARTHTHDILQSFREYWSDLFTHEQDKADLQKFDIDQACEGKYPSICDEEITQKETEGALRTLKSGKASGLDDIPPEFLKDRSSTLVRALTLVFNEVLDSGNFPKQWKTDKRIPLYKSGGKTLVSNYRLIAIHSIFRKIFCTILHERIRTFIQLDDAQNGFRENRRGSDNALILNNIIKQYAALILWLWTSAKLSIDVISRRFSQRWQEKT